MSQPQAIEIGEFCILSPDAVTADQHARLEAFVAALRQWEAQHFAGMRYYSRDIELSTAEAHSFARNGNIQLSIDALAADDIAQLPERIKKICSASGNILGREDYHTALTTSLIQRANIRDPYDPAVKKISEYIKSIADRLLEANGHDAAKENVQIVLYRGTGSNAWYRSHSTPPLIGVNINFLKSVGSVDVLAHVIGHELTHHLIKADNSKQQEIVAQANGLRMMAKAGYNPRAVIEAHKHAARAFDRQSGFHHTFNDDHSTAAMDLREMENVLAYTERTTGKRYGTEVTALPAWVKDEAAKVPEKSYLPGTMDIDRFWERFHGADEAGKIGLTASLVSLAGSEKDVLETAIRQLTLDIKNPASMRAFDAFVGKCLSKRVADTDIYHFYDMATQLWMRASGMNPKAITAYNESLESERFERHSSQDKIDVPKFHEGGFRRLCIGELAAQEKAWKAFWSSRTAEEASRYAAEIHRLDVSISSDYSAYLSDFNFERLVLPGWGLVMEVVNRGKPYIPPYVPMIKFLEETNDPNIYHVLNLAGVNGDPWAKSKLQTLKPTPPSTPTPSQILPLAVGGLGQPQSYAAWMLAVRVTGDYFKGVERDDAGGITGLFEKIPRFRSREDNYEFDHYRIHSAWTIIQKERLRLQRRHEWEVALVEKADWSLLKTDFRKFIRRYHAALEPVIGLQESDFPFAERFIEEIDTLLKTLPAGEADALKADLKIFFTGAFDDLTPSYGDFAKEVLEPARRAVEKNNLLEAEEKQEYFYTYNPRHPLLQFAVRDPYRLFPEKRDGFLDGTRVFNCKIDRFAGADDLYFPIKEIYPELNLNPDNFQELLKSLSWLVSQTYYNALVCNTVITHYLTAHPVDVNPLDIEELAYCWSEVPSYSPSTPLLKDTLGIYIASTVTGRFQALTSLQDRCAFYIQCTGLGLLKENPRLRAQLAGAIAQQIENEPPGETEAFKIAAMLTCKHRKSKVLNYVNRRGDQDSEYIFLDYDGIIEDPQLRKQAVKLYAEKLARELGKDDGSKRYLTALNKKLDEQKHGLSSQIYSYIIPELAHRIEAQSAAAYAMRDRFVAFGVDSVMSQGTVGKYADFFTNEIVKNPVTRDSALKFLTHPYDALAGDEFLKDIRYHARRSPSVGHFYHAHTQEVTEHGKQAVAYIHRNFWAAPLEARVWYLEKILFPVNDTSLSSHQRTVDTIIDRVLPTKGHHRQDGWTRSEREDAARRAKPLRSLPKLDAFLNARDAQHQTEQQQQKHGFDTQSAQLARAIVQSYLSVLPVGEQRLLATAMLVADGSGIANGNPNVGKTLYMVLSQMGPAGTKLLQAINNHPQTPPSLKQELTQCQTMHQVPFRWDIISWLKQAGALGKRNPLAVKRVGPTLGAASLGVAVMNELADGKEVADTLLRPHAKDQALLEFDNMLKAVDLMVQDHPELAIVRDMIEEAKRSILVETDFNLSQKLNRAAVQAYEGIKVTVKEAGKTYHFTNHVVPIDQANDRMKRAELAKGEHFVDLPEATQAQRNYKRAAAKALFTTLLGVRLGGLPADKDRHGGNVKVTGRMLGHFDTGAQELLMPSAEQKRALGQVLGASLQKTMTAMSKGEAAAFDKLLVAEMENANEDPVVRAFLAGVKREFLATGAYRSVSDKEGAQLQLTLDDIKEILACLIAQDAIDGEILQGFKSGLGAACLPMMQMLKQGYAQNIQVQGLRENIAAYKAVELSEEETKLVTPDASIYAKTPKLVGGQLRTKSEAELPLFRSIEAFIASPEWQRAVKEDSNQWGFARLMEEYCPDLAYQLNEGDLAPGEDELLCFEAMYRLYQHCPRSHAAGRGFPSGIDALLKYDFPQCWPLFESFAKSQLDLDPSSFTGPDEPDGPPDEVPGGFVERLRRQRAELCSSPEREFPDRFRGRILDDGEPIYRR